MIKGRSIFVTGISQFPENMSPGDPPKADSKVFGISGMSPILGSLEGNLRLQAAAGKSDGQ
jgi:hypothetical protein